MASYSINQISRAVGKLYDEGITTDKQVIDLTYAKMKTFKEVTPLEKLVILEYSEALKQKEITSFLCGKKRKRNGGIENGISKQNTTD